MQRRRGNTKGGTGSETHNTGGGRGFEKGEKEGLLLSSHNPAAMT